MLGAVAGAAFTAWLDPSQSPRRTERSTGHDAEGIDGAIAFTDQTVQHAAIPAALRHSGNPAEPHGIAVPRPPGTWPRGSYETTKRCRCIHAGHGDVESLHAHVQVAIIDPSTDPNGWSFDKFYAEAASRMHVLPMLRWKYLDSPLGLNHPYWVDDPDFDLHYHIRRVACPPPADHKTLCEFMAAVYSYQLDRNRPLWMIWVVEGLADGKVACVMLVNHAYVDGVGASWLMQQGVEGVPPNAPSSSDVGSLEDRQV